MSKQKPASIFLFSIVLVISAFAGCSTNNPSGQSTLPQTPQATPATSNTSSPLGQSTLPQPMDQMLVRPVDDLKFVEWRTPPVPDGKGIAVISGDPASGTNILLHRFRRENPSTLHWHSSPYQAVVIRGTVKHWAEGGSEETAPPLGPGSYWFQPAKQVHADACIDASGECVILLHTLGKLDSTPAQPEKR